MSKIDDIEQAVLKEEGEGSIVSFSPSSFKRRVYEGYSGGSLMFNVVSTGQHDVGYVKGKIYEVYGPEGSGKTTLALHAIAEAQKKGAPVAFIDMEHALDIYYASEIGVKFEGDNRVLFSQPDSGESAFRIMYKCAEAGIGFIVLDSVAALQTQAQIDGAVGDAHVAQVARLMSQQMPVVAKVAAKKQVTFVFLNQLRMKIGVTFGNPETTPGGNALKFYTSGARFDVRANRQDKIASSDKKTEKSDAVKREESGTRFTVKAVKNKLAPPFQSVKMAIVYGKGIDKKVDLVKFGLHTGIVSSVTDKQFVFKAEGKKEKTYNFSNAKKEVYQEIYKRAMKRFKDRKAGKEE